MDRCPKEIVNLIVQDACMDDLGQTARRIGLVSKYFRAIAEPIELRVLSIAGIDQLKGAIARIERARSASATDESKPQVKIRHLFISELTVEHTVTGARNLSVDGDTVLFWETEEGILIRRTYLNNSRQFMELVRELITSARGTLTTLSLLSADSWFYWRLGTDLCSKLLLALSGLVLPKLVYLAVTTEPCSSSFETPVMPSLWMLRVVSSFWGGASSVEDRLLADVLNRSHELSHIALYVRHRLAGAVLKVIFGSGEMWEALLQRRALPGKLRSVILQQQHGCPGPLSWDWSQQEMIREQHFVFVDFVRELKIDGLEAHNPLPEFTEAAEREFDLLVNSWKDQMLASSV